MRRAIKWLVGMLASIALLGLMMRTAYVDRIRAAVQRHEPLALIYLKPAPEIEPLISSDAWRLVRSHGDNHDLVDAYYLVRGAWWKQVGGLTVLRGRYVDPKRELPKDLPASFYARALFCTEFWLDSIACSQVRIAALGNGMVKAETDSGSLLLEAGSVIKSWNSYGVRD